MVLYERKDEKMDNLPLTSHNYVKHTFNFADSLVTCPQIRWYATKSSRF
jgi:hypothetical protein